MIELSLENRVRERAANRCEYCRMHQWLQGATFHIEHVIPKRRQGGDDFENLALACPTCNLHKSDRMEAVDPKTRQIVPLFNPRIERWSDHFAFENFQIVSQTAIGRAAIALLDVNHPRKVKIRSAEQLFGLFPPD